MTNTPTKSRQSSLPSKDIQLQHLFPIKDSNTVMGYWEPGKRYLLKKDKSSEAYIIDELGTFVWNLCDGSTSVRQIEKILIKEADQQKETVRTSVATFLVNLKKKDFILFKQQ